MARGKGKTIRELVIEYFTTRPHKDLEHGPVVDWVTEQWVKSHDNQPRDVWRMIRALYAEGFLIQVSKGIYRYDPEYVKTRNLEDFTPEQKEEIFKSDDYKCVICGLVIKNGVEIHADHIVPRSKGGKAEVENGQTLCTKHNNLKKAYNQTETGKRIFIKLYEAAKRKGDDDMENFLRDVLDVFAKHGVNDQIKWKP